MRVIKISRITSTAEKLGKLCSLADELGISLSYGHRVIVEDRDRDKNLPPLYMEDIEDDHNTTSEFPPCTEYKLVYDNPDYLAQQEREHQERLAKCKAKQEAAEAKKKAEAEAREVAEAKELVDKELAELGRLEKKYKKGK